MRYIIFLLFFSKVVGQDKSLFILPEKPESNQEIKVVYKGRLKGEDTKLWCILYFSNNSHTLKKLINTELLNNEIVGKFILPDSVPFFQIKVANIQNIDNNNGIGFGFNVFKNNKPISGTFLREATSISLNNFFFNGLIDYQKAASLCLKEFEKHPEMKSRFLPNYLDILSKRPESKEFAINQAKINYYKILETGINQKNTIYYANIFTNFNFQKVDSLTKIVSEKYPFGSVSAGKLIRNISNMTINDPDSSYSLLESLKYQYKNLSENQIRIIKVEQLMAKVVQNDDSAFNDLLNKFIENEITELLFFNLSDRLESWAVQLLKDNNLSKSKEIVEKAIFYMQKASFGSEYHGDLLQLYSDILLKLGEKRHSLEVQKLVVEFKNFQSSLSNEILLEKLIENELKNDAITLAEKLILNNLSSAKIDSLYKSIYLNINQNISDFDLKRNSLELLAKELHSSQILNKLVKIKSPEFSFTDFEGATKKEQKDYNGQIIVLDFWAIWCKPCIASFPTMSQLLKEFKEKNVKFLFINTLEDNKFELKEKITNLIKKNNFQDFEVLFDIMQNGSYLTTSNFNIHSLPTKVILDKQGFVRFQNTGFESKEILENEIKVILNYLLIEK